LNHAGSPSLPRTIERLLQAGYVQIEPIIYEDFLPVSVAGIVQSNLGAEAPQNYAERSTREDFEEALGAAVDDELGLYAEAEARSLAASSRALGLGSELERQGARRAIT
jgi:uncharacterized glyoxalase superfamily metalloenzyme YdcJ